MEDSAGSSRVKDEYARAKPSRFTFKSGSSRRTKRPSREHDDDGDADATSDRSSKRSRTEKKGRESRHKHKPSQRRSHDDRHPTSTLDGAYYDPSHRHRESLYDDVESAVDPETAFRESLFDALADDEGAAYWEGVYGQPVHIYPSTKPSADGTLERMNEEEYAEYVRSKMWEKSHQHIVEEREARERARKEKKKQGRGLDEEMRKDEDEREHIRRRMAESLRRGEERRRAKQVEARWDSYTQQWDTMKTSKHAALENTSDVIPWPVLSGKAKHISTEEVEDFLRASKAWKEDPNTVLKVERVRWHPDKMQQRFGQHIDAETMKSVTAVFQIVDRLWSERR